MQVINYKIRKNFHPTNISGPDERTQQNKEEYRIN